MKGFNRSYFEKKRISAFRLLARYSGESDAWPVTFHCDEGYYLLIYNDGCDITLTSSAMSYYLSAGEMLLISPVMYNDPTFFPKGNAKIYAAIFCIPDNFCNIAQTQIISMRKLLNNCMITKAQGIPILRDMMIYAIDRTKSYSAFDEAIFNSIAAALIETISTNMIYTAISCADWQAYGARYCLHYLENSSAQDILLTIRHDTHYPGGDKVLGCLDTILIDLEGNIVYKNPPDIRDYRIRLPAGFCGFALMPLYGVWMTLEEYENCIMSPPPLNKMMRIAYYPYYFSNGEIVAGLPAGCSFSIGAITLVNILSSDQNHITFQPIKSLSWTAGKFDPIETIYLSPEHMTCIVHYRLFLEYGMTVTFRDNLIRCDQKIDGTPVVSSNMGCDARLLTEYPADIQRVVNYMRENPSTAHTI